MKNIQPLNPEALQKTMEALGGTAPTTPTGIDTSKIYQPPEASTLRVPPTPAPLPPGAIPATPQAVPGAPSTPSVKKRVAVREPGLKLFAGVTMTLSLISIAIVAFAYAQLHVAGGSYQKISVLTLLTIGASTLPVILMGVYFLLAKSVLMVRILLIVTGITYALRAASYGSTLASAPTITGGVGILLALGLTYWAWNVFKDVSLLED